MAEGDEQVDGSTSHHRLVHFERSSAGDFPFYRGEPVALTGLHWIIVLVGVMAGFGALIAPVGFYKTTAGQFLAAFLFFAIPLGALAFVAGSGWKAIFRKLLPRDLLWMFGVAAANIAVSVLVVLILRGVFEMNANPVGGMLGSMSGSERLLFYLKTILQLFGEEVVSVLPFLAILWMCHAKLGMSRTGAVVIAWLGAAVFFGALHLPTYGWNFVQCFLIIGTARLVLLIGYLATKNIWVSTGAHIINDWLMFTVMVIALGTQSTSA